MGERVRSSTGERGNYLWVPEHDRVVFSELDEFFFENPAVDTMAYGFAGVYCGVKPAARLEPDYVMGEEK